MPKYVVERELPGAGQLATSPTANLMHLQNFAELPDHRSHNFRSIIT